MDGLLRFARNDGARRAWTQNCENNPMQSRIPAHKASHRVYPARAVTIQIDAGSGTVSPLAKVASTSRTELVAAARTSGG